MRKILPSKKVALGLSGGVDSAVAAFLLKKQGYDVTGVYLQCWERKADGCDSDKDKIFAIRNAQFLNIPFVHLYFVKEYEKYVIKYFYSEYRAGRTPNPDVMCNKEIKFGLFYDWAEKEGFDFIATGHYARIKKEKSGKLSLLKGRDPKKDQSYFLYLLDLSHLARTLFPLGEMKKSGVRKFALEKNLPSAERPDSMGICFIGEVDIKKFLEERISPEKGNVIDKEGKIIGEHDGVWYYTVGQRHGFRLKKYLGKPAYVIGKDVKRNELVIGGIRDTYKKEFGVSGVHWISADPFEKAKKLRCEVRIRHLGKLYKAVVEKKNGELSVKLAGRAFGVAPGQSAVFYSKDIMLGGGVIS